MGIFKVDTTSNTVEKTCMQCGVDLVIPLADLKLGHHTSAHQINLPPCGCGMREVILAPSKDEAPGVGISAARKLAHFLARTLVDRSQVRVSAPAVSDPGYDAAIAAGDLVGRAAGYDHATVLVTDCGSHTDPRNCAVVEAEMVVYRAHLKKRVTKRTAKQSKRVTEVAAFEVSRAT